ncbi:MAG: flagellar basal body rod protein FlgB [Steroidobacteraceae bacterium]
MSLGLDAYLGIQPQALELQSRRMQVIADNLANVDTPNYKARDIDFRAALAAASGGPDAPVTLETTSPLDIGAAGAAGGASGATGLGTDLKYRVPLAPSLDGNTVDSALEDAAFAKTSVRYQATLTFLSTSLRNLMTAITGS